MSKGITDLKKEFLPLFDQYIGNNSKLLGEVPIIKGLYRENPIPRKFSAYFYPQAKNRNFTTVLLDNNFQETCLTMADLIDEGYNFLRVEASEILAFFCTDSDWTVKPVIPPHIPITYGL